jgi:hypothetical protein
VKVSTRVVRASISSGAISISRSQSRRAVAHW